MLGKLAKGGARILGIFLFLNLSVGLSQTPEDPFAAEALRLRTALHYDSALAVPLDSLVRLYRKEERGEELLGLYQAHIAQYPDDAGAKAVLTRILTAFERSEVDEFIQSAAQQHPTFSHLQYLLSVNLKKKDNERSLEALSNAIDLETGKNRRSQWLGELLDRSKTEKGRELATVQLKKLLLVEGQTGPTMFSLGQVMLRYQFWELGLEALSKALAQPLSPEQKVEANVLAAKAEAALGQTVDAGKRLDGVLGILAPDHYRRNEIMSLRVGVIATNEERLALLDQNKKAYEKFPEKETAILDYAEILIVNGNLDEALKVLRKGSIDLPESDQIEKLAIEQIEKRTNPQDLIDYLGSRLEVFPERTDLRYRLVKAHYEKGDYLAAEQDFDLVMAGLEGDAKASRILDLARFLRAKDKAKTSVTHYEAFLALEPNRLDVTRELCEVYLGDGLEEKVKKVLAATSVKAVAMENLIDLSQFLIDEQIFGPAEVILKEFNAEASALPFEPGLLLAQVHSELGKRHEASSLLQTLREQTDTPARYKKWLSVGLLIADNLGSIDDFFDSEQSLFAFVDNDWTVERIEKFLYLCEAGERRQLTERVAAAIQRRLSSGSIDSSLGIKLRQLLVRTLEKDPAQATEVEKQLNELAKADPDRINEYDLRRALLYHNVQRPDLATEILQGLNLEKVESTNLLRDSYRMLMEFGDRKLAGDALAVVTALEPSDLISWERRLSLLAAEGNESDFRAAIRSLMQGIAQRGKAAQWRDDTRQSLQWHLLDSYWRSIADIVATDSGFAESLPLLEAVERESQGQDLLWINWARAYIYDKQGREEERSAAMKQLSDQLSVDRDAVLSFPDGLTIPLAAAMRELNSSLSGRKTFRPAEELPLFGLPKINWALEIDEGATVLRMRTCGRVLIILDNRGQIYQVDAESGKLLWKESPGIPTLPMSHASVASEGGSFAAARKVRQMITAEGRFLLAFGHELRAYGCSDGALLWKAQLPIPEREDREPPVGAATVMQFDAENDRVVLFDPITNVLVGIDAKSGKLVWENTVSSESSTTDGALVSMNTGISIKNGRVLVFGKQSGIYEVATGNPLWGFTGEDVRVFPITLREQLDHLSDEELINLGYIKNQQTWTPISQNRRHDMSYLSIGNRIDDEEIMSFLDYQGSLLAPAVDWAKRRSNTGEVAHAFLSDDYLWLMDSRGLRLVSLNLPLASQAFDIQGALLGEKANHAWILNEDGIIHVDGAHGSVNTFPTDRLGANVAGTVVDGRVYVRGVAGVVVYYALSGKEISRANWEPSMIEYLSSTPVEEDPEYAWQGFVKRAAPGHPAYCYPSSDVVVDGKYYTVFGGNRIVAITD